MSHRGLKDFIAARKVKEALYIMEELGLQRLDQYGSMLSTLDTLDFEQGRYKEAQAIYNKAKAVLDHSDEVSDYAMLLSRMANAIRSCTNGTRLLPATRRLLNSSTTCAAPKAHWSEHKKDCVARSNK